MKIQALPLCLPALAFAGVAAAAAPASPSGPSIFEHWDESGLGRFSGKLQSLLMHRDMDDSGHGTSATLAGTLNYQSPEWNGLHFGGQFIYSWLLFEDGRRMDSEPGYWLGNDEFRVLNEAYLGLDLDVLGWEGAELKLGRQVLNHDFAPTYNIRQKDQSYEGVVLTTRPMEKLTLDLGWFHKFSSWASRDGGPSSWRADFIGVERRVGVPYASHGFFFASAAYAPCEETSLAFYDFYGDDLFNVFGVKGSHGWTLGGNRGTLTLRGHWANQQDVGRMSRDGLGDISSNVGELGLDYASGGLSLGTGVVLVRGDDFQTPFRTSFTIDTELLWYTMQFEGGTDSAYLKGVWKRDDWMFYAMYVASDHRCGRVCQELDVVVGRRLGEHLGVSVKAGYGDRRFPASMGGKKTNALDLRGFVTWSF